MVRGTITALVTPFTEEGALNEEVLRQLIRFQIASQVDGIVILGTTGEAPTLTGEEKERVMGLAREEIPSSLLLIVGTGSYSTAQTIENTRLAEQMGADAALIVTPYYNKPTQEGLYQHFKAVAESSSLPFLLYNIQGRTGQNLQVETLQRLAEIPTILGIKEASGNLYQMMEIVEKIKKKHTNFSLLSGDDALTLPCIALGGDGIVSVASNLLPKEIKRLTDEALTGNFDRARDLHYHLLALFQALFIETNPIPIKAALNLCRFPVGGCRLPLCSLSKESEQLLKEALSLSAYQPEFYAVCNSFHKSRPPLCSGLKLV
jgi:4-hydroxy-tetrahydrodipicolinate synthase